IGVGSAIFHSEASRVARMASGGRLGFAQSLFQVGGNIGTAIGPLMAAFIIIPRGQGTVSWYALVALTALVGLWAVGNWYANQNRSAPKTSAVARGPVISRRRLFWTFLIIGLLVMSKNVYMASMTSFYAFFLIEKF